MINSILLIFFVTVNTIASQLILKYGVQKVMLHVLPSNTIPFLLNAIFSPYIIGAVLLQGIGFIVWILVVAKMKVAVAFALSGSFFYILMAVSSYYFLGEKITLVQWAGISIITIGVMLLTIKT